jgi:hypothetical protein
MHGDQHNRLSLLLLLLLLLLCCTLMLLVSALLWPQPRPHPREGGFCCYWYQHC